MSFAARTEPALRCVYREIAEATGGSNNVYVFRSPTGQKKHPHLHPLRDLERMGLTIRRLEDRERLAPSPYRVVVPKEPLSPEDRLLGRCRQRVV